MKLAKNMKAVVKTGRPVQIVAIQANTPTALGTAMMMEAALKKESDTLGKPGREHVVHPHAEAQNHRRDGCERHGGVADERPAAEHRQAVRHHAHRGQHDGVNPGMTEHPEQVLPQQRLTAARHIEEMRAEIAVHPEEEEGKADGRNREDIGGRRGHRSPCENRHAIDRHARRAQAQEGDNEIDRADGRRDAEQDHAQRIEIDIRAAIIGARRIRHVIEPAVIWPEAAGERGVKENSGAEIDPIGERV